MTRRHSTVISPNDHMWKCGQAEYFAVGLSALACIERALATVGVRPASILDLPCGHGRVCRMLRAAFPDAHLTACDIDRDGADFCAAQFQAEPAYSRVDIGHLRLPRSFDLIWCGSLFTHLDCDRWPEFLEFFADHLSPGGVLVFTTHGPRVIRHMAEASINYGLNQDEQRQILDGYAARGFGFVVTPCQPLGMSLSSTVFVRSQLERMPRLAMIDFHEAGWLDHQDVVSCVRMPMADPSGAG
jgi:SAM-dependent methyltransferase